MEHLEVYIELVLPLAFFLYTHFLDERVHAHLDNNDAYHIGKVKYIFRYQWEMCLLVISLFALLGVRLHTKSETWSVGVFIVSVASAMLLTASVILILTNKNRRLTATPFYLAIIIWAQLIAVSVRFYLIPNPNELIIGDHAYGGLALNIALLLLSFLVCFIWSRVLRNALFHPVVLKDSTLQDLKRTFNSRYSGDRMRIEAMERMMRMAKPGTYYWRYAKERLDNYDAKYALDLKRR